MAYSSIKIDKWVHRIAKAHAASMGIDLKSYIKELILHDLGISTSGEQIENKTKKNKIQTGVENA
jgi:hypothetical protein